MCSSDLDHLRCTSGPQSSSAPQQVIWKRKTGDRRFRVLWAGESGVTGDSGPSPGQIQTVKSEPHNVCKWTPFSIILDSLESSHRAQQDYVEKHHSPTRYCKNQRGKDQPLFRKPEMKYLLQMKSKWRETNFVEKRTTNATLVKIKQVKEILQIIGREKPSARMNRQNLQYRKHKIRRKCKPFSVNLALSWQARQAPRPHHDKRQIRTNKDDCMDAKVCALYDDTIKILGREPLLIVWLSIL